MKYVVTQHCVQQYIARVRRKAVGSINKKCIIEIITKGVNRAKEVSIQPTAAILSLINNQFEFASYLLDKVEGIMYVVVDNGIEGERVVKTCYCYSKEKQKIDRPQKIRKAKTTGKIARRRRKWNEDFQAKIKEKENRRQNKKRKDKR